MPAHLIFNRDHFRSFLFTDKIWDVVVIGGGATGLGVAVDSATRGYKTLLLEAADFAKGTSSRSTKLVHGGVRYLAQGDIGLVYEALSERGTLLKNAPHLVERQSFIIPCYGFFSKAKFLIGLKLYDWLSGRASFGSSCWLNRDKIISVFPSINAKGLTGGVEYFDGQFDDARLAISLAQTAAQHGAVVLNYAKVIGFKKTAGKISGVRVIDLEEKKKHDINAKVVINATGVFVDGLMRLDAAESPPIVRPSQGIHLVFDASFLPGNKALMIPKTADGRVLFAIPWHNRLLVGTTDTPLQHASPEPAALPSERAFILQTLKQYLTKAPTEKDVRSVFAGLRPLAAAKNGVVATKGLSRSHKIIVSDSGLVTITGGKWTTYRRMAKEAIDKAIRIAGLPMVKSVTKNLRIHGYAESPVNDSLSVYGADVNGLKALMDEKPSLKNKLVPNFDYTEAEVVWAVRCEMARTVEDVLARRLRLLFLDADSAVAAAPRVAALMTEELGQNKAWEKAQVEAFTALAKNYGHIS